MDTKTYFKMLNQKKEIEFMGFSESDAFVFNSVSVLLEDDVLSSYFGGLKKYPTTAVYKNISISHMNSASKLGKEKLVEFLKGATTILNKIDDKRENKNIREVIFRMNEVGFEVDKFTLIEEKYKRNENLAKEKNLNLTEKLLNYFKEINPPNKKDIEKILEVLDVDLYNELVISNGKKLMNSIISNKYRHLINEETISIFQECFRQGIDKRYLQSSVSTVLAGLDTPEEFNDVLSNVIGLEENWEINCLKEKIKNSGSEVLLELDGVLYVDISTLEQANKLGSKIWCLTRSEQSLENYVYLKNDRLIFKFDTNKKITDLGAYSAALFHDSKLIELYDKHNNVSTETEDMFEGKEEFNNFKNIIFPSQSEATIKKRESKFENMISRGVELESRALFNIIKLNRIDFISKINEESYINLSLNSVTNFIGELKDPLVLSSIMKNVNVFSDFSSVKDLNYHVFLCLAKNDNVSKEQIIEMSKGSQIKRIIENIEKRTQGNYFPNCIDMSAHFFQNISPQKLNTVLTILNDGGIPPSKIITSQELYTFNNLDSEKIKICSVIQPDFIRDSFELNKRRSILLFSSKKFDEEISSDVLRIISKTPEIKGLLEAYGRKLIKVEDGEKLSVIKSWIKEMESERIVKTIEPLFEGKKRLTIK